MQAKGDVQTWAEPVRDMSISMACGPSAPLPTLPSGVANLASEGNSSNRPTACLKQHLSVDYATQGQLGLMLAFFVHTHLGRSREPKHSPLRTVLAAMHLVTNAQYVCLSEHPVEISEEYVHDVCGGHSLTMAFPLDLAGASIGVPCAGEAGRGRAAALARATARGSIIADMPLATPICFSAVASSTGACSRL